MIVQHYCSSSGRDLIMEYIDSLPIEEQIDAHDVMQAMKNDEFDKLYIKPWQGKIKEVYFRKHNRIFYIVENGKEIFLLHACRKQKNKTEKKDAKIVKKRAKEIESMYK